METKESVITSIIFVGIFSAFIIFALVVVIWSLNQANSQQGTTSSGSVSNETLYNISSVTQTLYVNGIYNPTCSITSVTNLVGDLIDPSNYTVNNCQVTIK